MLFGVEVATCGECDGFKLCFVIICVDLFFFFWSRISMYVRIIDSMNSIVVLLVFD